MKLNYFNIKNFGDALNPIIFYKLLPGFFDEDPSVNFFGIGSIIGENMKAFQRKIIFSSGYAYGKLPILDTSFDIVCVRGPLTAKALKLDNALAITDGAALLREFNFKPEKKEYEFSFMPHIGSETKFPWKNICTEAGINYVSPTADPMFVISEILKSKVVVAEAMHFAIVADTLRVPWVAVKAYSSVNSFKWQDWTGSLNMSYRPWSLGSLFEHGSLSNKLRQKTRNRLPGMAYDALTRTYLGYQNIFLKDATVRKLRNVRDLAPQLSNEHYLNSKTDGLLEKLEVVRKRYDHVYSNRV